MTMNLPTPTAIAPQLVMLFAALMLVLQLLLVVQKMLLTNIRLYALQSLMLSAIALVIAWYYHATHVYIVAVLTLSAKSSSCPGCSTGSCAGSKSWRRLSR